MMKVNAVTPVQETATSSSPVRRPAPSSPQSLHALTDYPLTAKLLGLVIVVVACSSKSEPTKGREPRPKADGAITHEERCPGVRAVWTGDRTDGYEHYKRLRLEIEGGKRRTRDIEKFDSDTRGFGIFSPDCKRVLLLQSRMGPFHIVRVSRLAAYADGAEPDHVLAGEPSEDGISGTGVFRRGAWVSNTEVSYTWGCCEPAITTRFVLPEHRVAPSVP